MGSDHAAQICSALQAASAAGTPLRPVGADSRAFYGNPIDLPELSIAAHRGIVDYDPTELVVTARAGTPLAELEGLLEVRGQQLAFEPPRFAPDSTVGGAVASGLAGPARPWSGPVRDHLLGVRIATGTGELLSFGGRVIKNVAGYDVSRVFAGSLGCLGVLLELHLRTTPRAERELTLVREATAAEAIKWCAQARRQPWPVSGACHVDGRLYLRLQGGAGAVARAAQALGGEQREQPAFWQALRDQTLPFFAQVDTLWRLSVPPATAPLAIDGEWLIDWGGAQRWLATAVRADEIRAVAAAAGGTATLYRGAGTDVPRFPAPKAPALAIQRRLKQAFDPEGILAPGRLQPGL